MHRDHSNPTRNERLAVCGAGSAPARAHAALRYGMLLLMVVTTVVAIPASAAEAKAKQIACPALLLDQECRAYQADMSSATTADTRDAIKARYADLLSERKRACFCIPDRSWIQLTSTTAPAQDNLRRTMRTSEDKLKIRL